MLNHGGKRCKMRVGDNRLTMHTFLMLNIFKRNVHIYICTFVYTMLFLMLSVKFSVKSYSYLSVQFSDCLQSRTLVNAG